MVLIAGDRKAGKIILLLVSGTCCAVQRLILKTHGSSKVSRGILLWLAFVSAHNILAETAVYTFEQFSRPNSLLFTPIFDASPDSGPAAFRASFTALPDGNEFNVSDNPPNQLFSGNALFQRENASPATLTVTLNTPVTSVSVVFATFTTPAACSFLSSSGNASVLSTAQIGSDGGTLTFNSTIPFTSFSLTASSAFAIDNVVMNTATAPPPTPTPTPLPSPSPTPTPTPTPPPTATATPTPMPTATVTPVPTPIATPTATPPAQLRNISTRVGIQTGAEIAIAGFIIDGVDSKRVLIRGMGPSLAALNVPNTLQDPVLELQDANGSTITTNDDWKSTQQADIETTQLAPADDREAVILATLAPGSYTAFARGKNNSSGIGLIEVYDLDPTTNSGLSNMSTRGFVQTGANVMIGGCILSGGTGVANIVVRALGPSLSGQSAIANSLADPTLALYDRNGTLLAFNDNWKDTQQLIIEATGLQPSNELEAAIFTTLPADNYTVIVAGTNAVSGVALLELYRVQ